ncbi:copper-binding protein [Variovorax sp. YR216]|uniref:copper-binding protein n=1 Tax=Variovorax sp. YR216 TaxID=1882828 RepID=UPI000B85A1C2|nr:copper-binding protein [Variovorax sp. YR216]
MKLNQTLFALALAGASLAHAQSSEPVDHAAHHTQSAASEQARWSEGEVRKVNREAGKLTLRHGPLENLDMPAMTMVFTVADPKLLDGLNEGDKVRFAADRKDGKFVVTAIERVSSAP